METKYHIGDILKFTNDPDTIMLIEDIESVTLSNSDSTRQAAIYRFRNLTKNETYSSIHCGCNVHNSLFFSNEVY